MNPNTLPSPKGFSHHTDIQIRFSDVDVLGHVNNTVYLAFYDTGKAHFFSSLLRRTIDWKHVETVIANVDCAFVAPIFYGEEIEVVTRCESVSEKSFRLLQMLVRKTDGQIKSACETIMVSFDPSENKAVPLPEIWRDALTQSIAEHRNTD